MEFNYTATWHCFKALTATLIDGASIMPMRLVELTEELQKHFFHVTKRYCCAAAVRAAYFIEKSLLDFINREERKDEKEIERKKQTGRICKRTIYDFVYVIGLESCFRA